MKCMTLQKSIQSGRSGGVGSERCEGLSWQLAQWADAASGRESKGTRPGMQVNELVHAGRSDSMQY